MVLPLSQMESLFGSLPEMLDFQRVFLQTLEDRISCCPNLDSLETPEQFQVRTGLNRFNVFYSSSVKTYELYGSVISYGSILFLFESTVPLQCTSDSDYFVSYTLLRSIFHCFVLVATSIKFDLNGFRLLPESSLLAGRLLPVLRRPLQALQRVLCEPQQGPEGSGER